MNKRLFRYIYVGLLFILVSPIIVRAETYSFDEISFILDDNYTVTTSNNVDTSTYIPLEYKREQVKELFDNGTYSLLGINKDKSNIKFKIIDSIECGSIANNKSEMNKCLTTFVSGLKEKESVDLVHDNTFTNKVGINYYTLEYFKYGSTLLDVITSYNNKIYTFTLATSYSKEDIEKHAKEIMDSVILNNFAKKEESEEKESYKEKESDNNNILIIGAVGTAILLVGGASICFFKKK